MSLSGDGLPPSNDSCLSLPSSSFVFDVVFRLLVGLSLPQQESMGSDKRQVHETP